MMEFDLVALRTFVTVCETGNLTAAGRLLGMTQAAISQRIKKLENEVRARLIDRDLRPIQLTPTGQLVYERARAILAEAGRLDADLLERSHLPLPELRLGVADSLGSTLVPPLVDAIKGDVAQLAIRVDSSANICKSLVQRELHAVISSDPLTGRGDLERYELYREPMVIVLRSREKAPGNSELATLEWLASHKPFIRYSPVSPLARQIEVYLSRLALEPPRNLEFNTSEAILEMVLHGLGWAITTPLCLVQTRIDFREISVLRLPSSDMSRAVSLLARRGELGSLPRRLAATSRTIIDEMVVKKIGQALPWLVPAMSVSGRTETPVALQHNELLG